MDDAIEMLDALSTLPVDKNILTVRIVSTFEICSFLYFELQSLYYLWSMS